MDWLNYVEILVFLRYTYHKNKKKIKILRIKTYLHLALALGGSLQRIAELGALILRAHLAEYLHHVLVPRSQLASLASSFLVLAGVEFGHFYLWLTFKKRGCKELLRSITQWNHLTHFYTRWRQR